MSELKICPFCGSNNVSLIVGTGLDNKLVEVSFWYVYCSNCFAKGGNKNSREEAKQIWNKVSEAVCKGGN